MTIYFKNGTTKKVVREVAEVIVKRLKEGCGKFQTFSDEAGDVFLIVNLDEIVYIA
jgi:hypothetical protein